MGPALKYSACRPEVTGNWFSQDTTPAQTQSPLPFYKIDQFFNRALDMSGFSFQVSLTWGGFMTKYAVEETR